MKLVMPEYAPLPPRRDEAKTVTAQLHEGGTDGYKTNGQTPVLYRRVDKDDKREK